MKMYGQGCHHFSIHEEPLVQSSEKDDDCGESSRYKSRLQGTVHAEQSKKHGIAVYLSPFV